MEESAGDVLAAVEEDPASEIGRALAIRWKELEMRTSGPLGWVKDPDVTADFEWLREKGAIELPAGLERRFRESATAKVVPFIMKAIAALAKKDHE